MLRALLTAALIAISTPSLSETRLLMLDRPGCEYCARWDAEVGVVYGKTAEGRRAPLTRRMIHAPSAEHETLARRAHYTPTFIVLNDNVEVGRIEGYPGEAFFYGMLNAILDQTQETERERDE